MVAINRLYVVVLAHKNLWGENSVRGSSAMVGIRIFSIVGG